MPTIITMFFTKKIKNNNNNNVEHKLKEKTITMYSPNKIKERSEKEDKQDTSFTGLIISK